MENSWILRQREHVKKCHGNRPVIQSAIRNRGHLYELQKEVKGKKKLTT